MSTTTTTTNQTPTSNKRARLSGTLSKYPVPFLPTLYPNHHAHVQIGTRFASKVPYSQLIDENQAVLCACLVSEDTNHDDDDQREMKCFVRAGPRAELFFKPSEVVAGIVTCGGLCPGLNSVIRELVKSLYELYGVKSVIGFQNGYGGIYSRPPRTLTLENTHGIQNEGGTVLLSSRGGFDADKIFAKLDELNVSQLYVVGGDGTMRGAAELSKRSVETGKRPMSFVGLPKTIDNDVAFIDTSFGFTTAVEESLRAVRAARVEAQSTFNGVGIVQVMGRYAGYIATHVALASGDVDLVLIPEVKINLDLCMDHIIHVLQNKGHAVIVVGEGAGEEILGTSSMVDAGGNRKLPPIGPYIRDKLAARVAPLQGSVKYIDPSYTVRAGPANAADSSLCLVLSQSAVHAAFAGYTSCIVGMVNNRTSILPIDVIVKNSPRRVDPCGRTWERVVSLTGQPYDLQCEAKKV